MGKLKLANYLDDYARIIHEHHITKQNMSDYINSLYNSNDYNDFEVYCYSSLCYTLNNLDRFKTFDKIEYEMGREITNAHYRTLMKQLLIKLYGIDCKEFIVKG